MEAPPMSSGNTGFGDDYQLLERLRDCEFPNKLYAIKGNQYLRVYWYDSNGTLRVKGSATNRTDDVYESYLADYNSDTIHLQLTDDSAGLSKIE